MTDSLTQSSEVIKETQKLDRLEEAAAVPLVTIKTVFPFRFFPCVISLDREKLTITAYFFFSSMQVENFLMDDVVSIALTQNWFFASLTFLTALPAARKISASYFWYDQAHYFRRISQGMRIAKKEKIDVTKISDAELIKKLEEIGSSAAYDV